MTKLFLSHKTVQEHNNNKTTKKHQYTPIEAITVFTFLTEKKSKTTVLSNGRLHAWLTRRARTHSQLKSKPAPYKHNTNEITETLSLQPDITESIPVQSRVLRYCCALIKQRFQIFLLFCTVLQTAAQWNTLWGKCFLPSSTYTSFDPPLLLWLKKKKQRICYSSYLGSFALTDSWS